MKKTISIIIDEDTDSDISDILCWFGGYMEGKGEDWEGRWLRPSIDSLREVNRQIKQAAKPIVNYNEWIEGQNKSYRVAEIIKHNGVDYVIAKIHEHENYDDLELRRKDTGEPASCRVSK